MARKHPSARKFKPFDEAPGILRIDVQPSHVVSATVMGCPEDSISRLLAEGFTCATLEQISHLRRTAGKHSPIIRSEEDSPEAVLYSPCEKHLLLRRSPIFDNIDLLDRLTIDFPSAPLPVNIQDIDYIGEEAHFPTREQKIPTDRFDSYQFTRWAFGAQEPSNASLYGDFLRSLGIDYLFVHGRSPTRVSRQGRGATFLEQLSLGRLTPRQPCHVYTTGLGYSSRSLKFRGIKPPRV